jgi:hypothetical protein
MFIRETIARINGLVADFVVMISKSKTKEKTGCINHDG